MKQALLILLVFAVIACATTPITGRKFFSIFTPAQENAQGEQAYRQILAKEHDTANTQLAARIEAIGRRIAAVSERPDFSWEFHTIESTTPNAFCLPGGKVAFYTGIIPFVQNDAGAATVMGHEIGHAIARHGGQRMTQQLGLDLGLAVSQQALKDTRYRDVALSALGAGATIGILLPYSRAHESEADEIGLILMARAGYDPREAPKFWDRFAAATKGKQPPEFLSTHPHSENRKAHLESLLPQAIPVYDAAPNKTGAGQSLSL
jgi:predicted Zn-dependent protease